MDKLTNDELINIMQQMKTAYDNEISNMKLELHLHRDLLQNDNEFDRKKITDFCRCKECNITIKNVVYYGNGEETHFQDEIHKCNICSNRFCEDCIEGADAPNQYYCNLCEKIKNIKLA